MSSVPKTAEVRAILKSVISVIFILFASESTPIPASQPEGHYTSLHPRILSSTWTPPTFSFPPPVPRVTLPLPQPYLHRDQHSSTQEVREHLHPAEHPASSP